MSRLNRTVGGLACVCLAVLLAGCSVRHPTLLAESDLARAEQDSLGLDEFLQLPVEDQQGRTQRAEKALNPLVATEAMEKSVQQMLDTPSLYWSYHTHRFMPALGDVIDHLDAAVGLDPTRGDLWLVRARLLDIVGDERRARETYAMAWDVCQRVPDRQADARKLRRDIAVGVAWIERDAGYWDAGLAWMDLVRGDVRSDDTEAGLVRGLLLAGRGDLEAAMHLSYGLPPIRLPLVGQLWTVGNYNGAGWTGLQKRNTDLAKRWLQAEVWMRRGEPDLAWHVLGDIPYWRRIMPLPDRLYQDLGLYAELTGNSRANLYYALAYIRRPYRQSTLPIPLSTDPVIRGLPDRDINFYRLQTGAFHGGSLFAYAGSSAMLAMTRSSNSDAEQRYLRAQDALDVCIRRGIHAVESLALRGQLRFSRGYYVLAEMDLALARQQFSQEGVVEPWTSYLLGLISMGRDRSDEAITLLEEAVGADRTLAGAWNALGVAWLQQGERTHARLALDRAVENDPTSVQAWYNRGLLRCQVGDLDGGILDFKQAVKLDPMNNRTVRVIQLATVAKRDGKLFLPGRDNLGAWSPAPIDVTKHEEGEFSPQAPETGEVWLQHLEKVLSEAMDEAGRIARAAGFDAAELASIEQDYREAPTPEKRKVLAYGFTWLDLPDEAQRVLEPHWGNDLDGDEMLLLLWLDQRAGETQRLAMLAREMGAASRMEFAGFKWNILALDFLAERHPQATQWGASVPSGMALPTNAVAWQRHVHNQMLRMSNMIGDRNGAMLMTVGGNNYGTIYQGRMVRGHGGPVTNLATSAK